MKLASIKTAGRDGSLIVVDRTLSRAVAVPEIAPTLQTALEEWFYIAPRLERVYSVLNQDQCESFPIQTTELSSPLPRAYQWLDGSAYLSHVERVRKARGADMPPSFLHDPLMYQGGSDSFLGPSDPIFVADEKWGIDFEAEVVVITNDVEMDVSAENAASHIKLIGLVNDISLRNLIPSELAKGFGFLQGKPSSAFSPVAVMPEEIGSAWDGARLHLPLMVYWNDQLFGEANTGVDMQFDFAQLIRHAAKTRRLSAGTLIGSGTVSNQDSSRGFSCIVERRMVESLETGEPQTDFMRYGDKVRIEMLDSEGRSIFGAIEQEVRRVTECLNA